MSVISTHVLDVARGLPAAGLPVRLERVAAIGPAGDALPEPAEIASARTDDDGRVSLAGSADVQPGTYRLVFDTSAYFQALPAGGPAFFPEVAITFTVRDLGRGYHVPLLLSPFGYSTYRGS